MSGIECHKTFSAGSWNNLHVLARAASVLPLPPPSTIWVANGIPSPSLMS